MGVLVGFGVREGEVGVLVGLEVRVGGAVVLAVFGVLVGAGVALMILVEVAVTAGAEEGLDTVPPGIGLPRNIASKIPTVSNSTRIMASKRQFMLDA